MDNTVDCIVFTFFFNKKGCSYFLTLPLNEKWEQGFNAGWELNTKSNINSSRKSQEDEYTAILDNIGFPFHGHDNSWNLRIEILRKIPSRIVTHDYAFVTIFDGKYPMNNDVIHRNKSELRITSHNKVTFYSNENRIGKVWVEFGKMLNVPGASDKVSLQEYGLRDNQWNQHIRYKNLVAKLDVNPDVSLLHPKKAAVEFNRKTEPQLMNNNYDYVVDAYDDDDDDNNNESDRAMSHYRQEQQPNLYNYGSETITPTYDHIIAVLLIDKVKLDSLNINQLYELAPMLKMILGDEGKTISAVIAYLYRVPECYVAEGNNSGYLRAASAARPRTKEEKELDIKTRNLIQEKMVDFHRNGHVLTDSMTDLDKMLLARGMIMQSTLAQDSKILNGPSLIESHKKAGWKIGGGPNGSSPKRKENIEVKLKHPDGQTGKYIVYDEDYPLIQEYLHAEKMFGKVRQNITNKAKALMEKIKQKVKGSNTKKLENSSPKSPDYSIGLNSKGEHVITLPARSSSRKSNDNSASDFEKWKREFVNVQTQEMEKSSSDNESNYSRYTASGASFSNPLKGLKHFTNDLVGKFAVPKDPYASIDGPNEPEESVYTKIEGLLRSLPSDNYVRAFDKLAVNMTKTELEEINNWLLHNMNLYYAKKLYKYKISYPELITLVSDAYSKRRTAM